MPQLSTALVGALPRGGLHAVIGQPCHGLLMPLNKMPSEESTLSSWNDCLSYWTSARVTCLSSAISLRLDESRAGPAEAKLWLE